MRVLFLLPLLALACVDTPQPDDPPASESWPAFARITPEGGTYRLAPGVVLEVPAGAVNAELVVTARGGEPLNGDAPTDVLMSLAFEPAGFVFEAPIQLILPASGDARAFFSNGQGGFYQPHQTVGPDDLQVLLPFLAPAVIAPNQSVEEIEIIAPPGEVDVLFVIDNSCSMADQQALLASDGPSLLGYFLGSGIDYHIGVVSTDMEDPAQSGHLRGAQWIEDTTADPAAIFAQMVNMGTVGWYEERGMDAAHTALDTLRNTANAGFWRDDAALHVVFVSDEQDQSINTGPTAFSDWMLGSKYEGEAQVHAIVGLPTNPCFAVNDPGLAYLEAVSQTGGAEYDLCATDWSQFMDGIGFDATGWERVYALLHDTDTATLSVAAELPDGSSVTYDPSSWTHDVTGRTVTFDGAEVPPPGSIVRLSYMPL